MFYNDQLTFSGQRPLTDDGLFRVYVWAVVCWVGIWTGFGMLFT